MKHTLQVLNELEHERIFSRYAIGGAMAAIFYAEPTLTFDLDVFILLPDTSGPLVSLAPIYDALRDRGYAERAECVVIEGVPVQFLPAFNSLLEESLQEAKEMVYEDVATRVLRAEHLVAICLQTGREKDRDRVRLLRAQTELDEVLLHEVLGRYDLGAKWKLWTS